MFFGSAPGFLGREGIPAFFGMSFPERVVTKTSGIESIRSPMLLLDAFGLLLASALACAVWGPDVWRWTASHLGIRPPAGSVRRGFGFD